jgi:hypothetical protein
LKRIFKDVARCLEWLDFGQGYVAAKLKPVAKASPSKPHVAPDDHDLKKKALMGSTVIRVKFHLKPIPKLLKWRNYSGTNALGSSSISKSKEYKPKTNKLGLGVKKGSGFPQPGGHSMGYPGEAVL